MDESGSSVDVKKWVGRNCFFDYSNPPAAVSVSYIELNWKYHWSIQVEDISYENCMFAIICSKTITIIHSVVEVGFYNKIDLMDLWRVNVRLWSKVWKCK